ncbi:hypothetical protein [Stutzerimonas azotifigens]|uniref:Lipoprotein n=1 Tax=Stutzerimonas azotifigens TaxID=291995 RepID=A0ABR5YWY3_9GAMM|nr:hypothetical protein [Stutzerimonas azotifigens]MBA1272396.1 hypothetical protein [Stutzerimonas azotifigens]
MKLFRLFFLLLTAAWLTGCASPQLPIALEDSIWSERDKTIGVAIVELPKPSVQLIGNQGLLDLAINTGLAAGLRSKVETWELASVEDIPQKLADELTQRGYKAKVLPALKLSDFKESGAKLGYAKQDFTPLRQQQQVDKLILVSLSVAGTLRSYYSIMPTSDPLSQVGGLTQVIDLEDNRLAFYQTFGSTRAADGEWDEGPDYPNLTNAFYQALDESEQRILAPFRPEMLSAQ